MADGEQHARVHRVEPVSQPAAACASDGAAAKQQRRGNSGQGVNAVGIGLQSAGCAILGAARRDECLAGRRGVATMPAAAPGAGIRRVNPLVKAPADRRARASASCCSWLYLRRVSPVHAGLPETPQPQQLTVVDGLPSNRINDIAEDA